MDSKELVMLAACSMLRVEADSRRTSIPSAKEIELAISVATQVFAAVAPVRLAEEARVAEARLAEEAKKA